MAEIPAATPAVDRGDESTEGARLVSPNGFDGRGSVPEKVTQAAKRIAKLRVKFVTQRSASDDTLTTSEVDDLFSASALLAEWTRELYEAVHATPSTEGALRAALGQCRAEALDGIAVTGEQDTYCFGNLIHVKRIVDAALKATERAHDSCFCGRFKMSGFSSALDDRNGTWHSPVVCGERYGALATPSTELGRAREAVIEAARELYDTISAEINPLDEHPNKCPDDAATCLTCIADKADTLCAALAHLDTTTAATEGPA